MKKTIFESNIEASLNNVTYYISNVKLFFKWIIK